MPTSGTHLIPNSTIRYRPLSDFDTAPIPPWIPSRSSRESRGTTVIAPGVISSQIQAKPLRSTGHFAFLVAVAMLMLMLLTMTFQTAASWGRGVADTIEYGYPRTFQVDQVVGHRDSMAHPSHFVALNLNGQIEIIENPGGDAGHAHVYVGPKLSEANVDIFPVTLAFVDRNHVHLPDMEVRVGNSIRFWFKNVRGSFILEAYNH